MLFASSVVLHSRDDLPKVPSGVVRSATTTGTGCGAAPTRGGPAERRAGSRRHLLQRDPRDPGELVAGRAKRLRPLADG